MKKIGIFGGTFDPLHFGHINSLQTVLSEIKLNQVLVIPAFQSPHRQATEGPSPQQRLEMVRRGLEKFKPEISVEDLEVQRGGLSYTIDTVQALKKQNAKAEFYLVIGADQFESFDKWKNYGDLLKLTHLIVTSRPGINLPKTVEDCPPALQSLIKSFHDGVAQLKSKKNIIFIQLDDVEVSATEVRRRFRSKAPVKDLIPEDVETYIRAQGLYESLGAKIGDFEKFTQFCSQCLRQKNGIDVLAYDLRALHHPSEFTCIASGTSTRHTQSLAESLMKSIKENYGVWPQSIEGVKEGRWVVIDYGSLIIHIFYDFVRHEYRLEELWKEADELQTMTDKPAVAGTRSIQ